MKQVMKNGRRIGEPESAATIRDRFGEEFKTLDEKHKHLKEPVEFEEDLGQGLQNLQKKVVHEVREKELGES